MVSEDQFRDDVEQALDKSTASHATINKVNQECGNGSFDGSCDGRAETQMRAVFESEPCLYNDFYAEMLSRGWVQIRSDGRLIDFARVGVEDGDVVFDPERPMVERVKDEATFGPKMQFFTEGDDVVCVEPSCDGTEWRRDEFESIRESKFYVANEYEAVHGTGIVLREE
jgi:hypothetical protein